MGIGAFLLGMLFQENFWREIRQTLDVWGISRAEWHSVLWAIVGLSGVGASIVASAVMTSKDKIVVADKAIKKEKDKLKT
jgi:ABC-type dipeptide/oligopeptide/nickel transport system ATPase component